MTKTEAEILTECLSRCVETGDSLQSMLEAAVDFWSGGHGRSAEPRRWRSFVAAAKRLLARHTVPTSPGYPGPCPEGMDWSRWLAMNNVD